jgi:hypothetical protein
MSKREESVKLNLGTEHESEEEESEYEEDEVIDEDKNEDEEIIDYGTGFDENHESPNKKIHLDPIINEEVEKEKVNKLTIDVSPIKDNPSAEKMKKVIINTQASESTKKDLSDKTVFTRISEDLYKKFVGNKSQHNKKTSAYDYLINDMFLNRVVERNDKECTTKFLDFVNRNKEFIDKKKIRLQDKTDKLANEFNQINTGIPNGRVLDKNELRDPNEYLQDQLKYYQTRDMNIKQQQEDIIKNSDSLMKPVPEISKKSKLLAEKRLGNDSKEVHDRLFNEKLKKNIKLEEKSTVVKKSQSEIHEVVDKLYKDAEQRKENIDKLRNDKNKIKEIYHLYDSDDELTNDASKLKILEKFVQNFEVILHKMFNKKDHVMMNFEEYSTVMFNLGFVHHDYMKVTKDVSQNKLNQKELNSLKDAWRIIHHPEESKDISQYEIAEKIDSNQLLVFCATLLGLYKGEEPELILNQSVIQGGNLITEEKLDTHTTEQNVEVIVHSKIPTHFKNYSINEANSPNKLKKRIKMPNRFSTSYEKHTYLNLTGASATIPTTNRNKLLTSTAPSNNTKKNPIKQIVPEFDISKYNYAKDTAKQIKIIFRNFYQNREEHLYAGKVKIKNEKMSTIEKQENTYKQAFPSSEKLRQSAENFRVKAYKIVENEIVKSTEPDTIHESVTCKSLRLDEVYNILRKKKEQ